MNASIGRMCSTRLFHRPRTSCVRSKRQRALSVNSFVESFNHPGGNMTGVTSIAGALAPKRLELMREFLRDNAPIAILINPRNPLSEAERRDAEAAARAVGQRLEVLMASNPTEIDCLWHVLLHQYFRLS